MSMRENVSSKPSQMLPQGFDNYNISLTGEVAKTLQSEGGGSGVNEGCVLMKTVYDWHRQDTRMTELKDVCVTAAAGWGGGG